MSAPACCDLDDFIKAMADETRQEILRLLGQREMRVNDLGLIHFGGGLVARDSYGEQAASKSTGR
jgi:DNA-binding transcriptional ArsR family regulator